MLVLSVISAAPASAHTKLIKITPAADARMRTAPTRVTLEFNEEVTATFATVVVTDTEGVSAARGKPAVDGTTVTQQLSPGMASGNYRVAYRVISNDGHPVSGESKFTLVLAPDASPTPSPGTPSLSAPPLPTATATATAAAAQSTDAQSTDVPEGSPTRFLAPMAGATGLVFFGAGALWWVRRRR
jgi:hypothetical protein